MPEVPEKIDFCPRCGKSIEPDDGRPAPLKCSLCEKENVVLNCCGDIFCYHCGRVLVEHIAGPLEPGLDEG